MYFLTNCQDETTLTALKTYRGEAEKVTEMLMVFIRVDNTPEFKSNLWANYFRETGLIMLPTAPYSSLSNGMAERSIGVTTGAVQIMLLDARLSAKWWAEVWAFADYVENLLLSS